MGNFTALQLGALSNVPGAYHCHHSRIDMPSDGMILVTSLFRCVKRQHMSSMSILTIFVHLTVTDFKQFLEESERERVRRRLSPPKANLMYLLADTNGPFDTRAVMIAFVKKTAIITR